MGYFAGFMSAFQNIGLTLALDVGASLLGGKKPQKAQDLKNKSFRSDAYGTDWSRFRGWVRAQGKDLWGTAIQTSIWKTVSGGFFGLGATSIYYNRYSESRFVGFGEKLGGGSAIRILRVYADGKILFNGVASTGAVAASTVTVVGGGQQQGNQFALIDVASGGTLTLNAGDLIILGVDPQPYTVQSAVTATGPTSSVSVSIWPPLRQTFAGGSAVTLTQGSISPYDLSSFDPNPHDGSHTAGGYPCPPGGMAFYLGSDTQMPDPTMVKHLGAGNVPGYRGRTAVCLHDLQLSNYGDHRPAITAEIAYDVASPLYPYIGPIPGADVSPGALSPDGLSLPFSGNGALQWMNPLTQRLPFIWSLSQTGEDSTYDGTIYQINTQTHLLVGSVLVPRQGTFRFCSAGMQADNDGFLYFVQDNTLLSKYDGQALLPVASWPPFGVSSFGANVHHIYCWDTVQSLFGNSVLIKLMATSSVIVGPDSVYIFDRTVLLPLGTPNGSALGSVVVGYTSTPDGRGVPQITTGDPIVLSISQSNSYTDDGQGNLWCFSAGDLIKIDCQFISFINPDPQNPFPEFILPTFATTTINVASIAFGGWCTYYGGDNTIVVASSGKAGKVSVDTGAIVPGSAVTDANFADGTMSQTYDPMGTVVQINGYRVDLGSMQITGGPYDLSGTSPWVPGVFGGAPIYDPYSDSIWYNATNSPSYPSFGAVNQALLDRGNGTGIGLDSLVSSLLLENGYTSGQFNVTSLAAKTFGGWECERKAYKDSLQEMMRHFLFDVAEIDGKLVCKLRGQSSIATIPEDDLGALDDPSKYEPRVIETLQDERDVPNKVTVKYYDLLKNAQQATQEAKRIVQPYASSLTGAKPNSGSQQQLDIVSPLFDYATVVKPQADVLLWDQVAGRKTYKFKLGPKSIIYDPTDVLTLDYKGALHEVRIVEADFGSGLAREFTAVSQDASVYTTFVTGGSSGSGGGVVGVPPVANPSTYTINPASPLSEVSATDIHMVDVTATFSNGVRTLYNARDFTVPDPGGTPTLYYVTVYDPNLTGEVPGTASLTAFCDTNPQTAHVGIDNYIFMGTITITHDGVGVVVTSGGSGQTAQAIGFYVNGSGQTPPPSTGTVDLLTYMINSQRSTKHLNGIAANSQASNNYSYVDTSTSSIAQIKASAGWAADIQVYDANFIYQFITELDDVGYRLWSDNSSYKIFHTPIKMMPRFATPGTPIPDIVNSGSNPFDRYTSCSLIDTINRGVVTCRNYFATLNFDSDGAGGGNLGSISCLVHERYAGNSRERMYWGLNLGFVKWDAGSLVSGSPITGQYKITNWSVHNKLVAGGGVSLSLSCSITYP